MINYELYINEFNNHNLFLGRMISHSKSFYRSIYPYNKVLFNANICIKQNNEIIKIWWGDIDLSLEGDLLKIISKNINIVLYVFYEFEARSEDDLFELDTDEAFWNTTMNTPYITKEIIEEIKLKEKESIKQSRINSLKLNREYLNLNSSLPIIDLLDSKYKYKIDLPLDLLYEELNNFKIEFKKYKKPKRNSGKLFNKYFKEYGYFTYGILDKYLSSYFDIQNNQTIDPSSIWFNKKTNNILRRIDLEVEKMFDENFKYGDFKRYVTSNYCVPSLYFLNKENINIKSYENNILYIRENISKNII